MGRINGWKRQQHYSNLENAKENLSPDGRVKIGVWRHDEAGRIEHIYEPGAEREFIVRVKGKNRDFPEEGRYRYRKEGGRANKAVMEKYPSQE